MLFLVFFNLVHSFSAAEIISCYGPFWFWIFFQEGNQSETGVSFTPDWVDWNYYKMMIPVETYACFRLCQSLAHTCWKNCKYGLIFCFRLSWSPAKLAEFCFQDKSTISFCFHTWWKPERIIKPLLPLSSSTLFPFPLLSRLSQTSAISVLLRSHF